MTFETADDVLEHFGVKGMRWGVRKSRSGGPGKAKRAINKVLDDADIPGRANRRSNRMSPQQRAIENRRIVKVGQVAAAAALVLVGSQQIRSLMRGG